MEMQLSPIIDLAPRLHFLSKFYFKMVNLGSWSKCSKKPDKAGTSSARLHWDRGAETLTVDLHALVLRRFQSLPSATSAEASANFPVSQSSHLLQTGGSQSLSWDCLPHGKRPIAVSVQVREWRKTNPAQATCKDWYQHAFIINKPWLLITEFTGNFERPETRKATEVPRLFCSQK